MRPRTGFAYTSATERPLLKAYPSRYQPSLHIECEGKLHPRGNLPFVGFDYSLIFSALVVCVIV
ncbi:hypothetical protein HJFPF1_08028 [Paramyrothecium foliicola]|nr:hypothetical protein HJFPF1_08028 [Paramyrothecium foliicola]